MTGQTVIIRGDTQRALAKRLIDAAPVGAIVNMREATRTNEQNAKMQAMLSDVARAKPDGRVMPSHKWKSVFMDANGHKPEFDENLDRTGFVCVGYKSSRLNKAQMSDLIESIYEFGARHGVRWSDPREIQEAA